MNVPVPETETISASFDSLPDELLLKIIKMSSECWSDYFQRFFLVLPEYGTVVRPNNDLKYNYLVDVIGRVSVRFRRIATDS